jgi:hypothetical protein
MEPNPSSEAYSYLALNKNHYVVRKLEVNYRVHKSSPANLQAHALYIFLQYTPTSGQENREYDRRDPLRWPRNTLYPQKLVLLRQEAAVARSA